MNSKIQIQRDGAYDGLDILYYPKSGGVETFHAKQVRVAYDAEQFMHIVGFYDDSGKKREYVCRYVYDVDVWNALNVDDRDGFKVFI